MSGYRYLHLDVFTDQPCSGNQLAVFLDAAGALGLDVQYLDRTLPVEEASPGLSLLLVPLVSRQAVLLASGTMQV